MQKTPRGPYYTQDPEWFDARRDRILKARREGQTFGAIGKTWGITGGRVRQIVEKEFRRRNREVVQCEECGVGGLDPVEDVCGDWIGTEDNGYKCPDKLCRACRGDDDIGLDELTEEEKWAHADQRPD